MSPEAKQKLKIATDTIEAAFDAAYEAGKQAGIEIGVEQERGRLKKALFSNEEEEEEVVVVEPRAKPPVAGISVSPAVMMGGSLMQMARMMLAKDRNASFSIPDVTDYFASHYRVKVGPDQVRSLLKVLTRQHEAKRVSRGVYSAGPKLVVQQSLLGAA